MTDVISFAIGGISHQSLNVYLLLNDKWSDTNLMKRDDIMQTYLDIKFICNFVDLICISHQHDKG